jgi:hypothetical protein
MNADRRAIITETLHKMDDLSARPEFGVESTPAGVEKGIS